MEWSDEGILLDLRVHGENSAVASVLCREHGRHSGLIRGASGKRARGGLQTGNCLHLVWRARLSEHLGTFTWEPMEAHGGAWLHDPLRLAALASACALAESALPEREAHPETYEGLITLLASLEGRDWPTLYVLWELALLAELGYGLDLSSCAATGSNDNLAFVSPRSGRAVSLSAGEAYRDRLLLLPSFLVNGGAGDPGEVRQGLALTGYFLERRVCGPLNRKLPAARTRLVDRLRP